MKRRYIYGNEKDKDFFDTEEGNAVIGLSCGGGMIICIIIIFFMLIANVQHANAGELDAWEFRFFGINAKDFEGREPLPAIGGILVSFVTHELGHILVAEMYGGGGHFDWSERAAIVDDYGRMSESEAALFHGAGFIAQAVVGTALTVIPKTRHSDFTSGFNTFSSVTGLFYGVTGGLVEESSDVKNLDRYGYNGTAIAYGAGLYNGVLTYYSLDKVKE